MVCLRHSITIDLRFVNSYFYVDNLLCSAYTCGKMNKFDSHHKHFRKRKRNPYAKALQEKNLQQQVVDGKRQQYVPEIEDWELDSHSTEIEDEEWNFLDEI